MKELAKGAYADPNSMPPPPQAVALAAQHVLAMFASNLTPPIIIGMAVGFVFGGPEVVFMIQMAMIFSGIATILQTVGIGPVGARLPVMQGTSFAFIPAMISIGKSGGLSVLFTACFLGGVFHFLLGFVIKYIRNWFPPMVSGVVILMIGLALLDVGIQYAAGGVPNIGKPEFGTWPHWTVASVVIIITLGLRFFVGGVLGSTAVLIGLIVGYVVSIPLGLVDLDPILKAGWFALPEVAAVKFGWSFDLVAVVLMCMMAIISAIETVGDISAVARGGAGREATNQEIVGGTMADGLGTAVAGLFGGLPNTSFSQNVGLVALTGVMSRHVITISGIFLIVCGLIPKVGAAVSTTPIAVLGGGVIVMFGMIISAGLNMLTETTMNRRNMLIIAISLSLGLGLQQVPDAVQHASEWLRIVLTSGLVPAALIAVLLNLIVPKE